MVFILTFHGFNVTDYSGRTMRWMRKNRRADPAEEELSEQGWGSNCNL